MSKHVQVQKTRVGKELPRERLLRRHSRDSLCLSWLSFDREDSGEKELVSHPKYMSERKIVVHK